MPRAYSMDIRERIILDMGRGLSARQAAAKYHVSASFAIRLFRRWRETGSCAPKRMGGYRRSPLDGHGDILMRFIEEDSGITLMEVQARLKEAGIRAGIGSIWRFYERHGISYKKNASRR